MPRSACSPTRRYPNTGRERCASSFASSAAPGTGGAGCGRHPRQGRPVRDLLCQPQRARDRPRSGGDFPAQRHRDRPRREGELLRHAQVRARRSAGGGGLKAKNVPQLIAMIDRGYDIVAPIPSCVLMFKQELPLDVPRRCRRRQGQADNMFDPFEYLALRHKAGVLRTDFKRSARQDLLPRRLPPARAESRPQDPRHPAARARHHRRAHRALLGSRRYLRSQAGVSRRLR